MARTEFEPWIFPAMTIVFPVSYFSESKNITTRYLKVVRELIGLFKLVDKNEESYLIRNNFQKTLGYVLIRLYFLLNLIGAVAWKMGKIDW